MDAPERDMWYDLAEFQLHVAYQLCRRADAGVEVDQT